MDVVVPIGVKTFVVPSSKSKDFGLKFTIIHVRAKDLQTCCA